VDGCLSACGFWIVAFEMPRLLKGIENYAFWRCFVAETTYIRFNCIKVPCGKYEKQERKRENRKVSLEMANRNSVRTRYG
jgi:hypothetical protein